MQTTLERPVEPQTFVDESLARRPLRWNADNFIRADEIGFFGEKRLELIEGEIYEMSPIGPRHAVYTTKITDVLKLHFSTALGYIVWNQNPIKLSNSSMPQPDISILSGTYRDFLSTLPETAILMIEVADSTLTTDRQIKTSLYARYGIAEMWIVNAQNDELEIYRQPRVDDHAPHGFSYGLRQVLGREDAVSPLELPQTSIPINELLP